jgi:hypothetical protein
MTTFLPRISFGFDLSQTAPVLADDARALRDVEALPVRQVTPVELKTSMKDIAILKSLLKERPEECKRALTMALQGNMRGAALQAAQIGLSETEFVKREGGLIGLIIVAAALILLLPKTVQAPTKPQKPPVQR